MTGLTSVTGLGELHNTEETIKIFALFAVLYSLRRRIGLSVRNRIC